MCYYRWMDDQGFRDWWKGHADRYMVLGLVDVIANLREGATKKFAGGKERPDAALVKLYLERFDRDYLPKSRQELTGKDGVTLGPPTSIYLVGVQPAQMPETPANQPVPEKTASQDAPGATISLEDDQQDGEDVLS